MSNVYLPAKISVEPTTANLGTSPIAAATHRRHVDVTGWAYLERRYTGVSAWVSTERQVRTTQQLSGKWEVNIEGNIWNRPE